MNTIKVVVASIIAVIATSASLGSSQYVHHAIDDYNANPSSGYNNRPAFQNAINAISAAGGGTLYIPSGTYDVWGSLTLPPNTRIGVKIVGDGIGNTIIRSRDSATLFDMTISIETFACDRDDQVIQECPIVKEIQYGNVILEDFTISAYRSGNNGTAIKMTHDPEPESNHWDPALVVNRVKVSSSFFRYFEYAIDVHHGWNTFITDCEIIGNNSIFGSGIRFAEKSTNSLVRDCEIKRYKKAIEIVDDSDHVNNHEGIRIDNCIIEDVSFGLYATASSTSGSAWLQFTNNHVEVNGSQSYCVYITHGDNCLIRNNDLFAGENRTPSAHHIVVNLETSIITGNNCYAFESVNCGGIILTAGSEYNIVSNNEFSDFNTSYPVWLQSGTTGNRVTHNILNPSVELGILDQGTLNVDANN